jgi:hypothetical protein
MKHFPNFTKTQAAVFKLAVLYVVAAICFLFIAFSCTTSKRAITGKVDACPKWVNNIKNPENEEFVVEVAFNLHKPVSQVTQQEFNNRYLNN